MKPLTAQNIFLPVQDEDEKKSIFRSLSHFKMKLISKLPSPSDQLISLQALEMKRDELECDAGKSISDFKDSGELIIKFQSGTENYIFLARFRKEFQRIWINWKSPLYRVQRREHYRLRIPTSYKGRFLVSQAAGRPFSAECEMLDLSGGGMRIEVTTRHRSWKVGEIIEGQIHLVDRNPIVVQGQIRHLKNLKNYRSRVAVGIKFVGLSKRAQNRLIAIVMDLYREIFTKSA